jgi:hypothetical protein
LACATETHPRALYRLLRALASIGILAEDDNGRFALMPLAQSLRTKAPGSLRDFAVFLGSEGHWRPWGNLLYSVRTGGSAFEQIFGMQLFDYFAGQPEAARVFDAAMTNRGNIENQAIATAFDFPSYELRAGTVVDVGGGRGSLIATLLQRNTNSRGILFDLPHVMPRSIAFISEAGLKDRCEVQSGDFFDRVPTEGDIYLLKKIIHDWDDESARAILANCLAAMAGRGRLLLLEAIILPGNAPALSKLMDLTMLVQTPGGRERTETEYRTLLAAAGFRLTRIIPTESPLSIIEAIPS